MDSLRARWVSGLEVDGLKAIILKSVLNPQILAGWDSNFTRPDVLGLAIPTPETHEHNKP